MRKVVWNAWSELLVKENKDHYNAVVRNLAALAQEALIGKRKQRENVRLIEARSSAQTLLFVLDVVRRPRAAPTSSREQVSTRPDD